MESVLVHKKKKINIHEYTYVFPWQGDNRLPVELVPFSPAQTYCVDEDLENTHGKRVSLLHGVRDLPVPVGLGLKRKWLYSQPIDQRVQLLEVVLDGRATEDPPSLRVKAVHRLSRLSRGILDLVTLVEDHPQPFYPHQLMHLGRSPPM